MYLKVVFLCVGGAVGVREEKERSVGVERTKKKERETCRHHMAAGGREGGEQGILESDTDRMCKMAGETKTKAKTSCERSLQEGYRG